MATRVITAVVKRPNGEAWAGAAVDFTLLSNTATSSASYPRQSVRAVTDSTGAMSVTLAAGLDAAWRVRMPDGTTFDIEVGVGSTVSLEDLREAGVA